MASTRPSRAAAPCSCRCSADDPLITLGPDGMPDTGDEVPPASSLHGADASSEPARPRRRAGGPRADHSGAGPCTSLNIPAGCDESADDVQNANNTDTPWVDQSQTYTSHASHQVFLREYELNAANHPVSTGKLLGGLPAGQTYLNSPDGQDGIGTWAAVKKQAAEKLGLLLTDKDVAQRPDDRRRPVRQVHPRPAPRPAAVRDRRAAWSRATSPAPCRCRRTCATSTRRSSRTSRTTPIRPRRTPTTTRRAASPVAGRGQHAVGRLRQSAGGHLRRRDAERALRLR